MKRPTERESERHFCMIFDRNNTYWRGKVNTADGIDVAFATSDDIDECWAITRNLYDEHVHAHHKAACERWWQALSREEQDELRGDGEVDPMTRAKDERIYPI